MFCRTPRESVQRSISALRIHWFLAGIFLSSPFGWTQDSKSGNQEIIQQLTEQIKELQQRDHELEERIKSLEAEHNATSSPDPTPATAPVPSQAPTQPDAQVAMSPPEIHNVQGIRWRGFAEADYKVLNQRLAETGTYGFVPGSAGDFFVGDFDLFLTSRLTAKTSILADLDFQEADAQSFVFDLRRLLLKYDWNDHLNASFGRYQISLGYYNWAFRSAAWLQTTADRPLVMEYSSDGGILPTQAVGISVTGSIPSGKLGLNYVAEYGSSDTIRPDINGDGLSNDENNGNHINVGFFMQPDNPRGLRIGGSFYHDQISDLEVPATGVSIPDVPATVNALYPSPSARWNQTIVNGHVVYVTGKTEFLNEGFLIRHSPVGPGETFDTPAFYSQFSRKFGRIRPFVRYQYVNASARNFIYDDVGSRYGPSFGARYDLNDYMAFKAQLDRTARRGLPDLSGLHFQLAATF
jgi:hypothetical protein